MLISRYQMFKAVYFHKTVRSGEVMLLNSMKLQNESLHFTTFSNLNDFFILHDEMVLEKLSSSSSNDPESNNNILFSKKLAKDYQNRNLLKCVYEFFLLSSQRNKSKLNDTVNNTDKNTFNEIVYFDNQIRNLTQIVDEYQQSGYPIFLDISRAPSIPLVPKKEEVTSIIIMDKQLEYEKSFDKIPLINAITGYLDMIRIYTTKEKRKYFENIFNDFL